MTTHAPWSQAIDRMLARAQDTAARVKEGFPHWADPETGEWTTTPDGDWTGGHWIGMLWLAAARIPGILTEACFNKRTDARPHDRANRCEFIVGSYYLLESLLVLAGRLDPLRV